MINTNWLLIGCGTRVGRDSVPREREQVWVPSRFRCGGLWLRSRSCQFWVGLCAPDPTAIDIWFQHSGRPWWRLLYLSDEKVLLAGLWFAALGIGYRRRWVVVVLMFAVPIATVALIRPLKLAVWPSERRRAVLYPSGHTTLLVAGLGNGRLRIRRHIVANCRRCDLLLAGSFPGCPSHTTISPTRLEAFSWERQRSRFAIPAQPMEVGPKNVDIRRSAGPPSRECGCCIKEAVPLTEAPAEMSVRGRRRAAWLAITVEFPRMAVR